MIPKLLLLVLLVSLGGEQVSARPLPSIPEALESLIQGLMQGFHRLMGNVESSRPPRPPQRPSLSKAPPPTIPFTANDAPFNSAIKVVTPPTIVAPINNAIHQVPPRPSQGVRRPPLKNAPIRNGLKVVTSPRRPPRPAQEVQRPVNGAQKIPESSQQALKVVKSPSTSETIFRGQIANKHPGKHHKAKKHHHKPTTTVTILETEKVTTEATETETTPFVTEPAATTPSTTVPVQAVTEKLPESDEDLKTADVADNLHHLHPDHSHAPIFLHSAEGAKTTEGGALKTPEEAGTRVHGPARGNEGTNVQIHIRFEMDPKGQIMCVKDSDCPQERQGFLINSMCDVEGKWSGGNVCVAFSNQDCLEIHTHEECQQVSRVKEEERRRNAEECKVLSACERDCTDGACLTTCQQTFTCLPQKPVFAAPLVILEMVEEAKIEKTTEKIEAIEQIEEKETNEEKEKLEEIEETVAVEDNLQMAEIETDNKIEKVKEAIIKMEVTKEDVEDKDVNLQEEEKKVETPQEFAENKKLLEEKPLVEKVIREEKVEVEDNVGVVAEQELKVEELEEMNMEPIEKVEEVVIEKDIVELLVEDAVEEVKMDAVEEVDVTKEKEMPFEEAVAKEEVNVEAAEEVEQQLPLEEASAL